MYPIHSSRLMWAEVSIGMFIPAQLDERLDNMAAMNTFMSMKSRDPRLTDILLLKQDIDTSLQTVMGRNEITVPPSQTTHPISTRKPKFSDNVRVRIFENVGGRRIHTQNSRKLQKEVSKIIDKNPHKNPQ